MSALKITTVNVRTLQHIARDAADHAAGTLRPIVTHRNPYRFHGIEDTHCITIAKNWLNLAQACGEIITDIADRDIDLIDSATIDLCEDPTISNLIVQTPSPEHGPGWRVFYPADSDYLCIDIAAIIRTHA